MWTYIFSFLLLAFKLFQTNTSRLSSGCSLSGKTCFSLKYIITAIIHDTNLNPIKSHLYSHCFNHRGRKKYRKQWKTNEAYITNKYISFKCVQHNKKRASGLAQKPTHPNCLNINLGKGNSSQTGETIQRQRTQDSCSKFACMCASIHWQKIQRGNILHLLFFF